jgi:hypothetical protein
VHQLYIYYIGRSCQSSCTINWKHNTNHNATTTSNSNIAPTNQPMQGKSNEFLPASSIRSRKQFYTTNISHGKNSINSCKWHTSSINTLDNHKLSAYKIRFYEGFIAKIQSLERCLLWFIALH